MLHNSIAFRRSNSPASRSQCQVAFSNENKLFLRNAEDDSVMVVTDVLT
jgi:hypothetical protein